MGTILFTVINGLLFFLVWAIIISAIMSWLVAFDVINLRNRFVYQVAHVLEAVTRPVLRPFQRIIPSLGGVDISPIVVLLILQGIRAVLPKLMAPLIAIAG